MGIRLADYIVEFLTDCCGVEDIFMLTGYGSMYINDAVEKSNISYYATRNEATAPMMAKAYSQIRGTLGVACVTAGPGATNAIPGLAEAWVDSAPVMIISGQVERRHTTQYSKVEGLRTFGTAEINIIPIVRPLTKFAATINDPSEARFILEKAKHLAVSGRPGPVWIDIPLDVQNSIIKPKELKRYTPVDNVDEFNPQPVCELLKHSCKPLLVCGQGIRQSGATEDLLKFVESMKIPILFSRLGQDIISHDHPYVFGHGGIKGIRYCKDIMKSADLVIALGCRLAVQFVGHNFEAFPNARVVAVDIDKSELLKPGVKLDVPIHSDVGYFLREMNDNIKGDSYPDWSRWIIECLGFKNKYSLQVNNDDPIDLYNFMNKLGELSGSHHVLVTDAGSNYYIGGQVWRFQKGQREITSGTNAAMGTTIPLAVGCAVAGSDSQILAVTGDGSLELNIQELKTISHYQFNIKLFVINNGGYVSMKKWQDTVFEGRRIDTAETTGTGTLNLKNVAKAFDLEYTCIDRSENIERDLNKIMSTNGPLFIEVKTTHNQRIVDAFKDH